MLPYTYLLINLAALSVPLMFSFHPRLRFDKEWYAFFPAALLVGAVFIAWDVAFTRMGVWGFNPDYLCGIFFLGLPIEEWMFFLVIPYCCIYSYHCLRILIPRGPGKSLTDLISVLLIGVLAVTGILHVDQWYTSVTFLGMTVVLALIWLVLRPAWLGMFYLSWGLMLLPFFVVNGILTGSFLDAPVVWYNDAENLGIRLFTIPVEDTVYGMLLMLLNTVIFERIRNGGAASGLRRYAPQSSAKDAVKG